MFFYLIGVSFECFQSIFDMQYDLCRPVDRKTVALES